MATVVAIIESGLRRMVWTSCVNMEASTVFTILEVENQCDGCQTSIVCSHFAAIDCDFHHKSIAQLQCIQYE